MKRFVHAVLTLLFFVAPYLLQAQAPVKNYSFVSGTGTYTPITGTNSTAVGDNGSENGIPIGFNFFFGGRGYTHFSVSTNGFIKFGIATTSIYESNSYINNFTTDPTPAPNYPCIAVLWDNNHRNNGTISYATTGAVGSRVLTVQWDGVNIGGSGATSATSTASFQIKLLEGTNLVKLIYSNTLDAAGPLSASIGLMDGTSYLSITPSATPTTSSTTANNSISDLTNLVGKEYTLTPSTPLCSPTSALTISNITSSGALFTANSVSGASSYRFSFNTTGEYPTSSTSSSTPTYTAMGLLPNTRYYAMAQAVCPGGNGSGWFTTEFTTACAVLTLPYFQNFDTVTAPAIPPCTTTQDLNGGGAWGTGTATPYSVPNCLTYNSSSTVAANDWFYTAPMALSSGTTYRLTFYYRNSSGVKPEKLEVKCGTGNNATAMTNMIFNDANILNTNYKVVEQTFTVPSSGTYYIGFHDYSNADQLALNIDDIRVAANASCNPPTLLNVSIANGTSGVASWTAPSTGTVSSYQYAVTSSGTPPASGTSNATTSVNISGLTAGQLYYLHVRTICSGNSAWSTLPFYTPCPAVQIPYTENFDVNVTVPALPNCITAQDVNGGSHWNTSTSGAKSAPNSMLYNWDAALPGDDWFFTRAIRLNAGSSYKISYYNKVASASYPEKLEVKYGTANNAAGMTELLISDANITATTYQLVSKSFTPAATGDYYFGFHAFSDASQYYLYVDDISVDVATDCGAPINLAVATQTPSFGFASWSPSATGTVSTYQYAFTTSATPPETGITVTGTSVTYSGLQPLTQYYLHVKSLCVSGLYSTWATYAFTTPCAASDLPYVESFTVGKAPALPTCMSKVDVNGGSTWQTDSSLICSPTKALVYRPNSTLPGDDWAFTSGLNLTAGVAYELLFDYKTCGSYTEKLEVKYGIASAAPFMSNLLYSNLAITQTNYQTVSVRFTPTTSGVYYIGFHAISPANQASLYIDNIKVDVSHFCGQPGNPAVSFTNNTDGTVNWTNPTEGVLATYQYAITNSNIPPATGTVTTDTFATFNGLQVSARYFLHVRTNCSDGNNSAWTTFAFTTPCLPFAIPYVESFDNVSKPYLGNCMTIQDLNGGNTWVTDSIKPRSAPYAMTYHYSASLPGNDWAYTPGLSVVKGVQYRLSFYYKGRNSNYRERLEVKYGNAAIADSMATLLFSNTSIGDTTYQLAQADFTATRTGVLYIGFHVMSLANQWDLNIDDIKVEFAPGCGLPRDLAVSFATDSTGTASWSPALNGPPTGHQYAISSSRVAPASGTTVTEPSAPVAGLSQGVKYYLHVRTACSGGVFSAWVTDSFYTPCYGKTIPYIENFDGVTAPSLAPCISKEDLNGGTTWNNSTSLPKSAPNAMVYRYNTTLPANDWFYTAPLKLTGGTNYRLTFYYKGRSSSYKEKLEVKWGTANNVNSMAELLFADTNIVSTSYLLSATDFTPSTTGVYYIGFHALSAADQFDLNIDDIKVDIAPDCGKATNLSVTATGNTTGTAKWSPASAGNVTGYEYVVSNTAALPATGTYTADTSVSLTGLIPAKPYYLHVRTICSQDQFSLWSTIPFTIPCSPYSIPYAESFDSVTLPLLPPCMLVENVNGGNTWRSNEMSANSPNYSMYYVAEANKAADDWLYTPALDVTAGTSYRLSFYYKGNLPDVMEKLEVKYGTANNAAAMTHLIMKDTTINFVDYKLYRGDFVPDGTGPVYVGFHAMSDKNKSWLFVDDIKVDVSPNCSHPVNITAHLTHGNGGTITWSPSTPGTPTGYEYVIDTLTSNPTGTGTAIADSVVTLDGTLTLFKQYYFHVRSVCANGISTWETIPFYTLPNDEACNALNLLLDGPQSCGSTVKATAVNDPALATGCATNGANFTVWYKYTPTMSGTVLLRTAIPATNSPLYGRADWYTVTGNCADSGALQLVPGSVCRAFGQTGTGDIDSLRSPLLTAGVTYYIMISGIDYNSGDFCLRLISLPAPPCTNNVAPVNGATVTPPLGSNIKLVWSKTAGATGGYDVVLDTINPPTAFTVHVTDTAYVYTGLSYNKTYYWYVVPKDTLGNSSGCTSNVTSFTTTNPTICLPLTTYGCAFADSITYFSLKGEGASNLRNYSGNYCGTGNALGYSEYMALSPAVLSAGNAYTGFIKTADAQNYSSMWIDFNDNGYFEPTEKVLNNLQVGPTPTLYSILIPSNAAAGTHRLRIRNIYSATVPSRPLDPCNYYPYSETEDYAVTITSTPAALRSVASGSAGNCQVVATTTIDSASNNINATFVPVLDSNNNVVAHIYPQGNTLGRVNSSLYVQNGAVRHNNGAYYMNRNITIKPAVQPVTPYKLRIFYKTAELDSLIAQEGSRVTHDTDLVLTKTRHDSCRSGIADYVATDTTLVPSVFGDYNGDKFVEISNVESFSTFYFNGRHRYRFSGSGNWSNRANWANGAMPPTHLPAGDSLVIDHAPGGECILDVPLYIPSTGSIIVGPGKRLVIPGDLKPL